MTSNDYCCSSLVFSKIYYYSPKHSSPYPWIPFTDSVFHLLKDELKLGNPEHVSNLTGIAGFAMYITPGIRVYRINSTEQTTLGDIPKQDLIKLLTRQDSYKKMQDAVKRGNLSPSDLPVDPIEEFLTAEQKAVIKGDLEEWTNREAFVLEGEYEYNRASLISNRLCTFFIEENGYKSR